MKRSGGFTLVETILVLLLIGALIAAAVPNLALMAECARRAGMRGVMQSLNTAMQAYAAESDDQPHAPDVGRGFLGGST
jgi:type II secretory pathway pseudopilin PulG